MPTQPKRLVQKLRGETPVKGVTDSEILVAGVESGIIATYNDVSVNDLRGFLNALGVKLAS